VPQFTPKTAGRTTSGKGDRKGFLALTDAQGTLELVPPLKPVRNDEEVARPLRVRVYLLLRTSRRQSVVVTRAGPFQFYADGRGDPRPGFRRVRDDHNGRRCAPGRFGVTLPRHRPRPGAGPGPTRFAGLAKPGLKRVSRREPGSGAVAMRDEPMRAPARPARSPGGEP
jgi:hypothetical protein